MRYSILFIISLVIANNATSQTFIKGELRPRAEYRNGYQKMPDSTTTFAAFVSQRTRLYGSFKNELLQTYISLQDVRVWGEEKLKSDVPSFGLSEAWVSLNLTDSIKLKLGRQPLIYDNERILSNNNWQQGAQSHDAALLILKYAAWSVDFGSAFNQTQENIFGTDYSSNLILGNYKTLNFLRVGRKTQKMDVSIIGIADGFQKSTQKDVLYLRGTIGTNLIFKIKKLDFIARAYAQLGKTEKGEDIEAYYFNPELQYNFKKGIKINPGFEYFSGNDMTKSNHYKYQAFNSLYGSGHNFNGHMDYFTNIPNHTKQAGLIDAYFKNSIKLNQKYSLKADYHYFMLQNNFPISANDQTAVNKFLGHEVDASTIIEISNEVILQLGYSIMFGSKTLEMIKGGNSAAYSNWAFAMLTVKPTFYKSENKTK